MVVKGIKILIDKIDLNLLIRDYNWYWDSRGRLRCTSGKYRDKYLHRLIAERMGLDPSKRIYHKNNNRLDFRRSNLIDFPPTQESIRKNALIDERNMDLIENHSWSFSKRYLQARIDDKIQYLHILIAKRMGLDPSKQIDHIDRNPSNNYEANLREATKSQNAMNCKKHSNNTSGVTGVDWHKRSQKWRARISIDGKLIHLGLFKHKKDAIMARRKAEIKYFGEYRRK